jgi:hypothetical protein
MYNMFKTEFLKYRNRALIGMVVHLGLLAFMMIATVNLNARPTYNLWLVACIAASALFGILQMNAHKKTNQWIYLIQRPLAPWKIGSSLLAAGCLHIIIALVLPFVLYQGVRSLGEASFIELRHFTQLQQVVPAMLVFYVYACFSALYPHGLKFLGFTMAMVCITNLAGMHVELALAMVGLIASYCFYFWFKPDLETGASSPAFIVLSELPVQFGLFWLVLMFHAMVFQVGGSVLRTAPYYSDAHDSTESLRSFAADSDVLLAGLQGLPPDDARFYRQQIQLGELYRVPHPLPGAYPERNQRPSLDESLALLEPETGNRWYFMHSDMLFKGVDSRSGEVVAWLGPDGFATDRASVTRPFTAVPWTVENRFIVDARRVIQIDWENRRVHEKLNLDHVEDAAPGEYFKISLGIFENFATILSSTHLYILRTTQLNDTAQAARVDARVPLPMPDRLQTTQMDVMELIDGYLVGILVGANINELEGKFVSYERTGLFLYRSGGTGGDMLVNSRMLPSGYTPSQIYEGFVLAPGFRLLSDLVFGVIANNTAEEALPLRYHRFPLPVILLALLSMLGSALTVARLLRPLNVANSARITWVLVSGFAGLIGLACFYFGSYRASLMLQRKLALPHGELHQAGVAGHA